MTPNLVTWIVAFGVSVLATPIVRALTVRARLLDLPNARSSHAVPTPRTGGLAIVLGLVAAVAVTRHVDAQLGYLMAGSIAMSLLGFVDDVRGLSSVLRLLAQIAAAIALVAGAGLRVDRLDLPFGDVSLGVAAAALTVIWMVGVINAYNFMDGINGLAGAQGLIAGATLALLAHRHGDAGAALLLWSLAGACAGFLPWNLPSGSIFMGDVGSAMVGMTFAAAIVRVAASSGSFVAAALPLAPFLLDTTITLARRVWRRERVLAAHRSHFYQRLVAAGYSHAAGTAVWSALALVSSFAALQYERLGAAGRASALAVVLAAHAAVAVWIRGLEKRTPGI